MFAGTEIPPIGHKHGVLHLDAGLAAGAALAGFVAGLEAGALLGQALGVAIAGVLDGPSFLQAHPLLVVRAAIVVLHGASVPQVGMVGRVRVFLQHAVHEVRFAVALDAHDAAGKRMGTRLD